MDIAQKSDGSYSLSGTGDTLSTLPYQYDSEVLKVTTWADCRATHEDKFNVDSNTWSLSIRLHGDALTTPSLTAPDGTDVPLRKIYEGVTDAYYVTGGKLKP